MKIKLLFALALTAILGIAISDQQAYTRTDGSPGGYTGSPNDARTCGTNGGCHGGGSTDQPNWITSNIPASGYAPGETYSITATVEAMGINKFGFELSEEDASGNPKGMLIATTATQLKQAGKSITHRTTSTSGTDSKSWTFDWVAPAQGSGEVNFYAAFNASNNAGNTQGDQIFHSTMTVQEGFPLSNGPELTTRPLRTWPNPAVDQLSVTLPDNMTNANLTMYDISGKPVLMQRAVTGTSQLSVSDLPTGAYLLMAESGEQRTVSRVLVR